MNKFDFNSYNFKRSLLFSGPTGVGKTYQAIQLLKKYHDPSRHEKLQTYHISDALFKQMVKGNQLSLRKSEEYSIGIENFPLEMMMRVGVLLYDDLGVSDVSDAYLRDLTFILDERIKRGVVTIFTTNLKRDELKTRLNERIVSRILLNTDVIVFQGEDKRLATTNFFQS